MTPSHPACGSFGNGKSVSVEKQSRVVRSEMATSGKSMTTGSVQWPADILNIRRIKNLLSKNHANAGLWLF